MLHQMTQTCKDLLYLCQCFIIMLSRLDLKKTHIFDPVIFYRFFHLFSLIIFMFLHYKFLSFDVVEIHSFLLHRMLYFLSWNVIIYF